MYQSRDTEKRNINDLSRPYLGFTLLFYPFPSPLPLSLKDIAFMLLASFSEG